MTPHYRCPWCAATRVRVGEFLNHLFGYHQDIIRERLAMTRSPNTPKMLDPPRNGLNGHSQSKEGHVHTHTSGMPCRCGSLNPGVSGEGDSR